MKNNFYIKYRQFIIQPKKCRLSYVFFTFYFLLFTFTVSAAPYFSITGDTFGVTDTDETFTIKLNTDSQTVTAAQTVINFPTDLFDPVQVSTINSKCSFWAPADPSLGFGNASTPYFSGGNKVVLSCGFANPGYTTTYTNEHVLYLTLKPMASGSATLSFTNSSYRYIGTTIAGSSDESFDFDIYGSTVEAALANPTPLPSSTPTPTPVPSPEYLRASDITLVTVGSSTGSASTSQSTTSNTNINQNLDIVDLDRSIPTPPLNMTPRPKSTPYSATMSAESLTPTDGDVLSIQSLRELLIPGKSSADKQLVWFNLVITILFLLILAFLIYRLVRSSKVNSIKYRHLEDLITGEMAVLESKLSGTDQKTAEEIKTKLGQFENQIKT